MKFLFLLDRKLKQVDEKTSAEYHVEAIVKSVSECVDQFALLRVSSGKEPSHQWIINKIKKAIPKLINFSRLGLKSQQKVIMMIISQLETKFVQ